MTIIIIDAHHPDASICMTNPNDMETVEEWKYMNGTNFVIKRNVDKLRRIILSKEVDDKFQSILKCLVL